MGFFIESTFFGFSVSSVLLQYDLHQIDIMRILGIMYTAYT